MGSSVPILLALSLAASVVIGCTSKPVKTPGSEPVADDDDGGENGLDPAATPPDPGPSPPPAIAPTDREPSDRADDVPPDTLPFAVAPALDGIGVRLNRDNAILDLPELEGAADYRAFRLPYTVGVSVGPNGGEAISGTTIYCAGLRQHNSAASATPQPNRILQVNDLEVATTIVVEAIDTVCPFPGVVGERHVELQATAIDLQPDERVPFSIFTEAEVRQRYGSMIVNGHGPGAALGAQADNAAPRVLARVVLELEPLGGLAPSSDPPVTGFFDDFSGQEKVELVGAAPTAGRTSVGQLFQTTHWSFYSYAASHVEFSVDRGTLNMVIADRNQGVMASNLAVPKRAARLSDVSYLHLTFEVASNATQRRYWWLSLCGAEEPGQTIGPDGRLLGHIIQTPFFYEPTGQNPSVSGWNCLQLFPRDGWPRALGGTRPESDLRVMVNLAGEPAGENVVNVSPNQYAALDVPPSWYRRVSGGGVTGPMLDDHLLIAARSRFDVYVRRDRVIVMVAGEQRLCNDFPGVRLTMAEAAVVFGQILFGSAQERREFLQPSNDRSGQLYYRHNTPYLDVRSWDNLGFEEGTPEPAGFDPSGCYVH